ILSVLHNFSVIQIYNSYVMSFQFLAPLTIYYHSLHIPPLNITVVYINAYVFPFYIRSLGDHSPPTNANHEKEAGSYSARSSYAFATRSRAILTYSSSRSIPIN